MGRHDDDILSHFFSFSFSNYRWLGHVLSMLVRYFDYTKLLNFFIVILFFCDFADALFGILENIFCGPTGLELLRQNKLFLLKVYGKLNCFERVLIAQCSLLSSNERDKS